jgi:3-oxoacyl-[acyl-carrier-protein] synthase II
LVTCLGLDRAATWTRVRRGECGFRPLTVIESAIPPHRTGGQAPEPPELPAAAREVAYLRRAIDESLRQAGLIETLPCAPDRCGFVFGTTLHGMRHAGRFLRSGRFEELARFLAGSTLSRAVQGLAGEGLCMTLCSACSSGLASIAAAVSLLQTGVLDLVVAGGYDTLSEYAFGGFDSMRLVTDGPLRPFARSRDGMKLGEGYAAVVLERASDASARGAEPLAELLGFGETCDAHHLSKPHPQGAGAAAAITHALRQAGLTPPDIDLISAHATATVDNDAAEFAALSAVFGDALPNVPVVAFKSHLGHTLGAAGAVELVLAITALREQLIPPCANSTPEDVAFAGLRLATGDARRAPLHRAITLSLGFGGSNTCAVVGRPEGTAPGAPAPAVSPGDVVITGIGVVLPGITGVEAWARAVATPPSRSLDGDAGPVSTDELDALLSARRARRLSEYVKLTLAAATLAFQDAGIDDPAAFAANAHAVLGTTHGSTAFTEKYYRQIIDEGIAAANPMLFAEGVPNAGAAHLGTTFGVRGLCQTAIGTRTAGLEALLLAVTKLRSGTWQQVIVGAADEYGALVSDTYRDLGLHRAATRPLRRRRGRGFFTGAGAVTLIVETGDAVARRGARALGVVEKVAGARFDTPGGAVSAVHRVWWTLGCPEHVLLSANDTWIDDVERRALCRGGLPPSHRVSTIYGHLAECFAAGPLAGLAAVLATGTLPAWRLGAVRGPHVAAGDECVHRFAVLATDYAGSVVGLLIRRASHGERGEDHEVSAPRRLDSGDR